MPQVMPQVCEHCSKTASVMVQMAPGPDGIPWYLCGVCWSEGREPQKLGRFKVTVIEDPHLADALSKASKRTAGLIEMPPGTAAQAPAPRRSKKTRSRA